MPDADYVRNAFARIADRYVLANHVMSVGMDWWWRWRVGRTIRRMQPQRLLDIASGTGDLALEIQKQCPSVEIVATDFCAEMLQHAAQRGVKRTMVADALALPFDSADFDMITVAFGLRNMADYPLALREMHRVLAAEGHLLILDFSIPTGCLRSLYRWYLHRILPHVAGWITREKDAYQYLGASIEQFPQGEAMAALLKDQGFATVRWQTFSFGVVSFYIAKKSTTSGEGHDLDLSVIRNDRISEVTRK